MSHSLIMHINYCEQGQTLAEAVRKAHAWGFDGVEFRGPSSARPESNQHYLEEVDAAVEAAGLETVIFGGPGPRFSAPEKDVRERELANAIDFYEQASRRFDLDVCNILLGRIQNPAGNGPTDPHTDPGSSPTHVVHGSYVAAAEQWQWVTESTRRLVREVASLGITLAAETHGGFLHDSLESSCRLVDEVGELNFGLTFDYGNMYRLPDTPSLDETIRELNGRIRYAHIKNVLELAPGSVIPIGLADGAINNRQLISTLRSTGFRGHVCIEAPRAGDREQFAKEDAAYAHTLLSEITTDDGPGNGTS